MADVGGDERLQSRRERNRQRTLHALERAAVTLFDRQGYEHTTIDEITEMAGVSQRTFFRYFGSKEEVLLGVRRHRPSELHEAILARPAGEAGLVAVHNAYAALSASSDDAEREIVRLRNRVMLDTPSLRARNEARRQEWEVAIASALAEREHVPVGTGHRVLAAVTMTVLELAFRAWLASDAEDELLRLVTAHMAAIVDL